MADGRITTEAERQQARFNLMTPGQIAARLVAEEYAAEGAISAETVRSWCPDTVPATYRLRAVDCRKTGAKRPAWMARWEWVIDCMERRANLPPGMGVGRAAA